MRVNSRLTVSERGGALVGALILTAISLIILAGTLGYVSEATLDSGLQNKRLQQEIVVEESLNLALNWMRENSQTLFTPFLAANFYSEFDRVSPTVGSNDDSVFTVPVDLMLQGGNEAAMLVNDSLLGDAAFPVINGFDPVTVFSSQPLGDAKVRITLVNAFAENPAADYGDPDLGNPEPGTNFLPVFRIDAMENLYQGGHSYGYVIGSLLSPEAGFYGVDFLEISRDCDSYNSKDGPYTEDSKLASCSVASAGTVGIGASNFIYGSANSQTQFLTGNNWKGLVCSDFEPNCPNSGKKCEGQSCILPQVDQFDSWNTLCPDNQGNLTVNNDTTLVVSGDSPAETCWQNVRVRSKKTLTLVTTEYPYFFRQLKIDGQGKVLIVPDNADGTVELYINQFHQTRLDGEEMVNTSEKPYQFKLIYLNQQKLTITGRDPQYMHLLSPLAGVEVTGAFDFFGSIQAKELDIRNASNMIHYDRSIDIVQPVDFEFTLRNIGKYKREYTN